MKRALAERAKQSLPQAPPQETSSSSPCSHTPGTSTTSVGVVGPPAKIPRVARSSDDHDKNAPAPTTVSSSTSPTPDAAPSSSRGQKRQRGQQQQQQQQEKPQIDLKKVPDDASAFYLQHQNRALAVEWQSLNTEVKQLLEERKQRRQDCWAASQALHSLQATWTQLETVVLASSSSSSGTPSTTATTSAFRRNQETEEGEISDSSSLSLLPPSTGTGEDVEWTRALSDALTALSSSGSQVVVVENKNKDNSNWSHCASNLAARAAVLQERLLPILQRYSSGRPSSSSSSSTTTTMDNASLQKELHEIKAKCSMLQSQVLELQHARDAAVTKERKVRRNVYRFATGMMTVDQMVKAMEAAATTTTTSVDNDTVVKNVELQRQVALEKEQATAAAIKAQVEQAQTQTSLPGNETDAAATTQKKEEDGQDTTTTTTNDDPQVVATLQGKIADLEQIVSNREKSVQELSDQLKERELQINQLTAKQRSDEDTLKLQSLESTSKRLEASEAKASELEGKLEETKKKWSQNLGNESTVIKTMEEQQSKFDKRWSELSSALVPPQENDANGEVDDQEETTTTTTTAKASNPVEAQQVVLSRQIIELQHKLSQALENVRQAESTRQDLKDALNMNESLQAKLDEVRAKYAAIRNSNQSLPAATRQTSSEPPSSSSTTTSSTGATKEAAAPVNHSSSSSSTTAPSSDSRAEKNYEKLYREHRRMRKDLSAVMASKESAKAKLERAEKERDSLMEANARLLRQMTEKDDMNAKSLSTILHLKSMTEQLTAERDSLEQQTKSASQLALAARLATNAKERLSEEALKEKKSLEEQVEELEKKLVSTKTELDRMTREWSEASGKMTTLNAELANALKRSDELVSQLEKKNAEIRDLADVVSKSEREAREATEKLEKITKSSSGGDMASAASDFTVDQLNTQISVLKNRLACPVCHYRDKECIIMRCRHMHCKQCVEERISNRSRKCPTCNNKFSDKDVEDIWLN